MNDAFDIVEGDLLVRNGRIVAVGRVDAGERVDRTIDGRGAYLLPGFIQTHIHLCQTIFRGYADDLALLEWLKTRIWPMEAAHTAASLAASARYAASELLHSGTTTILSMETVHDTDAVFEALEPTGLRAVVGKCMMDSDAAVPARLLEQTAQSIDESVALAKRWHGRANGRLRAAFAPRFAVSCSRELLEAVAHLSHEHGLVIHTHASENRDEVALIKSRTGLSNIHYLADTGLASPRLCLAHCVWVDESEQAVIADRGCQGAALSRIELETRIRPRAGRRDARQRDFRVARRRRRGLQQPPRHVRRNAARGGAAVGASRAGRADGARRGLDGDARRRARPWSGGEIGCITAGRRADFILVDRTRPHLALGIDPYSTLVYAARGTDVRTTVVDGEVLVDDFTATRWNPSEVAQRGPSRSRRRSPPAPGFE